MRTSASLARSTTQTEPNPIATATGSAPSPTDTGGSSRSLAGEIPVSAPLRVVTQTLNSPAVRLDGGSPTGIVAATRPAGSISWRA